jgi:hypothetical protein
MCFATVSVAPFAVDIRLGPEQALVCDLHAANSSRVAASCRRASLKPAGYAMQLPGH